MSFVKVKSVDGQECAIRVDTIVFVRSMSQGTCEIGYLIANESCKFLAGQSVGAVLDEIELIQYYDRMSAKGWGRK